MGFKEPLNISWFQNKKTYLRFRDSNKFSEQENSKQNLNHSNEL